MFKYSILAATLSLAVVLAVGVAPGPAAALNCSDFASQAAAQAYLRANPTDPEGLDADHDGIACENNPAPYDRVPVARTTAATPTRTSTAVSTATSTATVVVPTSTGVATATRTATAIPTATRPVTPAAPVATPFVAPAAPAPVQPPRTGDGGLR